MTRSIGGVLDLRALAALAGVDQAVRHREHAPPPDRDKARVAARELRSRGLTPADIADALRLSPGAVEALLEDPT
jgi:hypothetical protein